MKIYNDLIVNFSKSILFHRYMSRYHGLTKEATQRLLDLAVEDNLIKLENKIGTKGNKSGIEEKAYRLPTADMLPR